MKKFAIISLVFIVALIGAVLAAPLYLDVNQYKEEIEETASEMIGRKVIIDGKISVSFFPETSLGVEDVRVENIKGGKAKNLLTLKSLDIKTGFFALLKGDIKAEKITLVGPVLHLEKLKNGFVNWKFKTSETSENKGSRKISIDKFELAGGIFSFTDLSLGTSQVLSAVNAEISMKSLEGPFDVNGSAKYQKLPVKINLSMGRIRKGKNTAIDIKVELFKEKIKAEYHGTFSQIKDSRKTQGHLKIKVNSLKDIQRALNILKNDFTSPYLPALAYQQDILTQMELSTVSNDIKISNMNFKVGKTKGTASFDIIQSKGFKDIKADVKITNLYLDPFIHSQKTEKNKKDKEETHVDNVKDDLNLAGIKGVLNLEINNLNFNKSAAHNVIIKAGLKNKVFNLSKLSGMLPGNSALFLKGRYDSSANKNNFIGQATLKSARLRQLISWLNFDVSSVQQDRLNAFKIGANIKISNDMIEMSQIKGVLDSFTFKGEVKKSFAKDLKGITDVKVFLSNISFNHYLKSSDQPFDLKSFLASLSSLNLIYDVKLKKATYHDLFVKSLLLKGSFLDNQLSIGAFKAIDFAGFDITASGGGEGFSSVPKLNINFTAATNDLRKLQRSFKFKSDINLRKIGNLAVSGNIISSFEKIDITAAVKTKALTVNIKAVLQPPTLKQLPEIGSAEIELSGTGTSYHSLINQFSLNLPRPLKSYDAPVAFKIALNGNGKILNILKSDIEIAKGHIKLVGRFNKIDDISNITADLNTALESTDLKYFINGLGFESKAMKNALGGLNLKAKFIGNIANMSVENIAGQIGTAKITGSGHVKMKADKKTFIDFKLIAGDIRVGDFFETASKKNNVGQGGDWDKTKFTFEGIHKINGHISIAAGRLDYKNYLVENPSFDLYLTNGFMQVKNLKGRLFGGTLLAEMSYDAGKGRAFNLDFNLRKASWNKMSMVTVGLIPIFGEFDIKGKFKAVGQSQYEIVKSFSGQAVLNSEQAKLKGVNFPAIGSSFKDLNNLQDFNSLLSENLGQGSETNFKVLNAALKVEKGKITLKPFKMHMPRAIADIQGSLDLLKWQYNILGDVKLHDLKAMPPIGLRVTGKVNSPKISYDTGSLLKYAAVEFAKKSLDSLIKENGGLEDLFKGFSLPLGKPKVPKKNKYPL